MKLPIRIDSRGVLFAMVVLSAGLKILVEHSSWGAQLEHSTYVLLQKRLRLSGTTERPQVLVIDISNIQPEMWERGSEKGTATPRAKLKDLISPIQDLRASAIGIDVDFSSEDGHPVHPDDPQFFDWCLQQSEQKQVPIFLGVYRTQADAGQWLDNDRYLRLAATIAVPRTDHGRTIRWLASDKSYAPLPSLAAALAGVRFALNDQDQPSWRWLFRSMSIQERMRGLRSAESVVDFSALKRIQEDVMPALDSAAIRQLGDKIRNRMILLGDCKNGDMFDVPGLGQSISGVFLHACAANTFATEPLYEFTPVGKIAMDVSLAVIIYAVVALVSTAFRYGRRKHRIFNFYVTATTVIAVSIISVGFVRATRLLWTDFILVGLVLLAHASFELIRWPMKRAANY